LLLEKNKDDCPRLRSKGQLYAVATECRGNPVRSVRKSTTANVQKKTPNITLKPIGKSELIGGNTFSYSGVQKNGAERYVNKKGSSLLFYPKIKKWVMIEYGIGLAIGNEGEKCPILKKNDKVYALSVSCVRRKSKMKTKDSSQKRRNQSKADKKKSVTKKSITKKKKPSNKKSKKKMSLEEKEENEKVIEEKKRKKAQNQSKADKKKSVTKKSVTKKSVTKKKKPSNKKSKKNKKSPKHEKKSQKSKAKKQSFITLKPVGKKEIVGGNKFKSASVGKDGVEKYSNGKSELLFFPKDKKWALKEKGLGWALSKKGKVCPTLSRKGKIYATSSECVAKKTTSKKSKKKATKKSKKPKAKKQPSIILKPIGKESIVGGNKFIFTGSRKDDAKKYSNGKSKLLFYPKDKKWALKEKGVGWASGKKGQMCPTLSRKGKLYATSIKCVPKNKNISSKKNKKIAKKTSKKSKKSKAKKQSFITLKPIGKKSIVGGNKFKSAGVRKDGTKKYSNGKSVLLFYPKDKKWALKEKGLGWASGKKDQLCPTLSRKGKLYATSTKCIPKKKKKTKKPLKKRSEKKLILKFEIPLKDIPLSTVTA